MVDIRHSDYFLSPLVFPLLTRRCFLAGARSAPRLAAINTRAAFLRVALDFIPLGMLAFRHGACSCELLPVAVLRSAHFSPVVIRRLHFDVLLLLFTK